MLDGIIQWSLRNRLFVILGSVILLVWGAYEAFRMPVDVFPDLSAPTVTVVAEAHGMAPKEVESLIAFPIETALNGASGVRRVRSSLGVGIAVIWVEFDWGEDIYRARQIVSEKLQLIAEQLPPDIEPPVLAPISSIMGEIMFIALTSEAHSPMEIKSIADWRIRRRILSVAGVSQVIPIGGDTRQYQVLVRPERLAAYGVGLNEVTDAVAHTNENSSAGFYVDRGQEYLIHGIGRIQSEKDIAETFVTMRKGLPVRVGDLAEVRIGPSLKRGDGSYNGRPAVILGIQKQPGANTLALTERLDEIFNDIQKTLPEGMEVHRHIFRQADFIEVAVRNVVHALRDGAILVVLILFAFLVSLRPTFITLLAIPLSLVSTILAMKWLGISINTMTLGGMAIAVGALVDDAIIDVENVVRRLKQNAQRSENAREPILSVVFKASKEIRSSIVFATLIIVLVFIPLFFLTGVEGRLLAPLGFAYIVSLGVSLLVALTVTPALCSVLLPGSKAINRPEEGRLVVWLKALYEPILNFSMRHWRPIAGLSLAGLATAIVALAAAGKSFLPDFNEGTLTISAVTLPGTSLEQSNRIGRMVEEILLDQPEVTAVARRTGRAELDEHAQGVNASEMEVNLKMGARSKEALLEELRHRFTTVPGTNVTIGQPISHRIDHMLSGTRANIAVKLFGEDLHELLRLGREIEGQMENVPGVVDLSVEQQMEIPVLTVKFDREAMARHGLSIHELAETTEAAFVGHEVSQVLEGQAVYDLVVRYETDVLDDLEAIRSTPITVASGAQVPLHALADVRKDRGPNTISRENVQRKIVIMCNVAGRDLSGVIHEIQRKIDANVELPPGYHIEYGGQFESAEAASRTLSILSVVVILGIFLLLFVALSSGRDAALVMANLPLALIGGVAGVLVSGGVLSIAGIIGFITLFGIATRNGLMMVSHIRHLVEEEGVTDPVEAVRRGALERLSPILMTALGTGVALIPLALATGQPGAEIQAPMAIVILFGLLSSTVLNMIVVPALYLRFGAVRKMLGAQGR